MDALLLVCISIAVLSLVIAVVLWTRRRRGRAVQAVAVGALPIGLYLTGLLPLIWSGAVELAHWTARIVFSPAVWAGVGLVGLAVVLWVIGGMVARRPPSHPRQPKAAKSRAGRADRSVTTPGRNESRASSGAGDKSDSEFDEIEALLRKRGIE